ncbi:MAG TPA: prephenate dehydrogenase, partial [Methylomirabilota bacterium]|nr:prephenate dehydrogenase [Methylomirabilota bacterium]
QARADGVVDRGTGELAEGVSEADVVVLCTPVGTLPGLVRAVWPALPPGSLLTDVGSVKRGVVEAAEACPPRPGVAFVGGHPMAGSERSGYAAATADLFEGRLTLLTRTARTPAAALDRLVTFWEALGSQVRILSVEAHDRGVALISHLPHLAAYALVAAADGDALGLAAQGFTDTTRIAASAETLWTDIFRENRRELLDAVDRYRGILARWEALLRQGDWSSLEAELERAREIREKLA